MNSEIEKSNVKKILMIIFFLNSSVMVITGIVVFSKDLYFWVRLVDVCDVIFWYVNMPIMGFFGLIIIYFLVRILIIMTIRLFCLIPAVNNKVDKENLKVF